MCAATRSEKSRADQLFRRTTRALRSHKQRLALLKPKAQTGNPILEAPSETSIYNTYEQPSKTMAASLKNTPGQLLKKIRNLSVTEAAKTRKSHSANRRELRRAAAILSTSILMIIAIATTSNTPQLPQSSTQAIKAEEPKLEADTAVAPSKPATEPKMPTPALIGEFGFVLGPAESSISTQPVTHSNQPLTVPAKQSNPLPVNSPVAEVPQPILDPAPEKKAFLDIGVELTINDGHVVEATVRNRAAGAEAFEATALNIARRRRYAPGTSRTETVVVRVATPGRNEP